MATDPVTAALDIGGKLIDRWWPDPTQAAQARAQLLEMAQKGELVTLQTQVSTIVSEAQSPDPWTSRARPSFLYVMYVMILMSVPMGILAAFKPEMAAAISTGMTAYLTAIPEPLYVLFGTGYLGYTAARQWGKVKGSDT